MNADQTTASLITLLVSDIKYDVMFVSFCLQMKY